MASGINDRIIDIFARIGTPTGVSVSADLVTIDALFDVTTADSTADATIRDVVGRKTDTSQTTVGTTSSIMRYVKGIITLLGSGGGNNILSDLAVIDTNVDTLVTRLGVPAGASVSADLVVIDAFFDVPAIDATTNAQMRDVIGNKSDAAQTTVGTTRSTIAYVKGLLNRIGAPAGASIAADIAATNTTVNTINTNVSTVQTRLGDPADATVGVTTINQKINTLDAFFDVPTADATTDTTIRDVLGRKTDTASQNITVNNVSAMRLIKGIIDSIDAPAAADNTVAATSSYVSELLGRKDDTASTTINTTTSMMRYVKGVVNSLTTGASSLASIETLIQVLQDATGVEYDRTTDSLQAIRDAISALGGGDTAIVNWHHNMPDIFNVSDAAVDMEIYLIDNRGNLITSAEITPGTCAIDQFNPGTALWVSILGATANSETSGIIRQTENFNGAAGYLAGRGIRVTFSGIEVNMSGNVIQVPTLRFYARLEREGSSTVIWGSNISGVVAADGTEQNILQTNTAGDYSNDFLLFLDVDLNAMAAGDTTVIRVYKMVDASNFRLYSTAVFNGVQENPIHSIENMHGNNVKQIRITVAQTLGILRSFPYEGNTLR